MAFKIVDFPLPFGPEESHEVSVGHGDLDVADDSLTADVHRQANQVEAHCVAP